MICERFDLLLRSLRGLNLATSPRWYGSFCWINVVQLIGRVYLKLESVFNFIDLNRPRLNSQESHYIEIIRSLVLN